MENTKFTNRKKIIGIGILIAVIAVGIIVALVLNQKKEHNSKDTQNKSSASGNVTVADYDPLDYVTIGNYEGVEAYYITPEVTDDQIQSKIKELLSQNVEYETVKDRGIKEGDKITIDFSGTIDGQEFQGGSSKDYEYIAGKGNMIEGFDDGLMGLKKGESTTLNLTFPKNYDVSVAGKDVVFEVTVKGIKEQKEDPEWNDAFCKRVSDGKYTSTKAYEESIKNELMESAKQTSEQNLQSEVWKAVIANMKVTSFPDGLYEKMNKNLTANMEQTASQYSMEVSDYVKTMYGMSMKEYVKKYVESNLITEALVKKIGIEVTDDEYQTKAQDLLTQTGATSLEQLEEYYGKEALTEYFRSDKLYDYLVDKANVKEVSQKEYDKLTKADN